MVIICRSLRPSWRISPALRPLSRQRAEVCGEDHSPNPTRTASHRIAAPPKKECKAHPDHMLICESADRISKLIFDSACQRAIVRESSKRYRTTKKKAPTAHAAALTRRRRPPPARPLGQKFVHRCRRPRGIRLGPNPHREGRADTAAILASISALHRLKYTAPPSLAMRLRGVRVRPRNAADGAPSFRQGGG